MNFGFLRKNATLIFYKLSQNLRIKEQGGFINSPSPLFLNGGP